MNWILFDKEKPPRPGSYLVVKVYLDAEFSDNGYDESKSFWTKPMINIDYWFYDNQWRAGGKITHWMPLPSLPMDDLCEHNKIVMSKEDLRIIYPDKI